MPTTSRPCLDDRRHDRCHDRCHDVVVRTLCAVGRTTRLLLLVAATWWVWLGWDAPGRLSPLPGDGVYHAWQGVGCLLSVLVLAVRGYRSLAPVLVGVAVTVGFSGAYALDVLGRHPDGPAVLAVAIVTVGAAKASLALGSLGPALVGRPGQADPASR